MFVRTEGPADRSTHGGTTHDMYTIYTDSSPPAARLAGPSPARPRSTARGAPEGERYMCIYIYAIIYIYIYIYIFLLHGIEPGALFLLPALQALMLSRDRPMDTSGQGPPAGDDLVLLSLLVSLLL